MGFRLTTYFVFFITGVQNSHSKHGYELQKKITKAIYTATSEYLDEVAELPLYESSIL